MNFTELALSSVTITITVAHGHLCIFLCEETPVPKAISVVTLTLHHCLRGCVRDAGCGWSSQ